LNRLRLLDARFRGHDSRGMAVKKLEYPVVVEPLPIEEGGGFIATVPDLPGCMSDGATPEEAISMCRTQSSPGSSRLKISVTPCPTRPGALP
jgi:hypothetical protein